MLLVGLTGGIGAGKSTVARLLERRGAVVIDADQLARDAIERGTPGFDEVVRAFGPEVVRPDGDLDRSVLAAKIFADPAQKATLEGIVHPEVARRFGDHLGRVEPVGMRWRYPLSALVAHRYTDTRLALVGDAAHGIHPIAGQGLNLGFRDVGALGEVIAAAVRAGEDAGSAAVLETYARWRRFDTAMTAMATDGLTRLFSNDNTALRAVRGMGLRAAGSLGVLKGFFMREAAGETGRLPKLLQGQAV